MEGIIIIPSYDSRVCLGEVSLSETLAVLSTLFMSYCMCSKSSKIKLLAHQLHNWLNYEDPSFILSSLYLKGVADFFSTVQL